MTSGSAGWQVSVRPGGGDPLRIVPLSTAGEVVAVAAGAEPAPLPQLVYYDGPLLAAVEVFTVFWGSWSQAAEGAAVVEQVLAFFDFVLSSELIEQLAEYSVPGQTIGRGSRIGTRTIATTPPGTSVSDGAIQQLLQQAIAAGTLPQPNANTLFFLFLPPGIAVVQGRSRSCEAFCGYHNASSSNLFYAVMPYPDCSGCLGGLSPLDALTTASSHELCEAITDPVPGQGWYDLAHGEIGDICPWQTKKLGAYTVQLEWSNTRGACV